MGNSNSDTITDSAGVVRDDRADFVVSRSEKTGIGTLNKWTHKRTGDISYVRGKMMDEELGEIQARLKFLGKRKDGCIQLQGISRLESNSGWCAAAIYELRFPWFQNTLHELVAAGVVLTEGDLWDIILSITRV